MKTKQEALLQRAVEWAVWLGISFVTGYMIGTFIRCAGGRCMLAVLP